MNDRQELVAVVCPSCGSCGWAPLGSFVDCPECGTVVLGDDGVLRLSGSQESKEDSNG